MSIIEKKNERVLIETAYVIGCDQCGREDATNVKAEVWQLDPPTGWVQVRQIQGRDTADPTILCSWRCAASYSAARVAPAPSEAVEVAA